MQNPHTDRAGQGAATTDSAEPVDAPADEWVTLALLVKPQGRQGELIAEILTDFPELFAERRSLYLRPLPGSSLNHAAPRQVTLEEHWLHKGRLVLKFVGIDTIEAADKLRNFEVVIPRAERAPLEPGAVYIGDLVGCRLHDRATGETVGQITDVDRESANMALLVVERDQDRGEVLIPFANAYQPAIDLAARRMEMTLPEGLLTLVELAAIGDPEQAGAGRETNGPTRAGRGKRPGRRG